MATSGLGEWQSFVKFAKVCRRPPCEWLSSDSTVLRYCWPLKHVLRICRFHADHADDLGDHAARKRRGAGTEHDTHGFAEFLCWLKRYSLIYGSVFFPARFELFPFTGGIAMIFLWEIWQMGTWTIWGYFMCCSRWDQSSTKAALLFAAVLCAPTQRMLLPSFRWWLFDSIFSFSELVCVLCAFVRD